MSSTAMNPHIHAFMEKKKPKTGNGIRTVVKRAEEDTTLNYPKDLQGTVLMCGPTQLAPSDPARSHAASRRSNESARAPPQEKPQHANGMQNAWRGCARAAYNCPACVREE